jgi:hypothetical protein
MIHALANLNTKKITQINTVRGKPCVRKYNARRLNAWFARFFNVIPARGWYDFLHTKKKF